MAVLRGHRESDVVFLQESLDRGAEHCDLTAIGPRNAKLNGMHLRLRRIYNVS